MPLPKKLQRSLFTLFASQTKLAIILLTIITIGFLIGCAFLYEVNAYFSLVRHTSILLPYLDNILQKDATDKFCSPVPIDVVYTWVNGSDPVWSQQLQQFVEQNEPPACLTDHEWPCLRTNRSLVTFRQDQWFPYYRVRAYLFNDTHAILPGLCQHGFQDIVQPEWIQDCRLLYLSMQDVNGSLPSEKELFLVFPPNETETLSNFSATSFIQWGSIGQVATSDPHSVLLKFSSAEFARQFRRKVDLNVTKLLPIGTRAVTARYLWPGLVSLHSAAQESSATHRFWDNEELRFSLRSLQQHAPWVRQVVLLTNGQLPRWLRLSHPRLRVVTHSDIFSNTSHLPTFNSAAIESHLHEIPGLSRYFIYMNDDVFFGQTVYPEDFYSRSAGYKVYLTWPVPNCRDGCPNAWISDGFCDKACNYSVCDWDGGDCLNAPHQQASRFQQHPGGHRRPGESPLSVDQVLARQPCAPGCADNWLADRYCDRACNVPQCGFDVGDCGEEHLEKVPRATLALNKHLAQERQNFSVLAQSNRTVLMFELDRVFADVRDVQYSGTFQMLGGGSQVRVVAIAQHFHLLFLLTYYNETRTGDKVILNIEGRGTNGTRREIIVSVEFTDGVESPPFQHGRLLKKSMNLKLADVERLFTGYPPHLRYPQVPPDSIPTTGRKLLATYADALLYTNRIFTRTYGHELRKVPGHMPHFIDRNVLLDVIQKFQPLWEQTSANRLRSVNDLQFAFVYYHYLMSEKRNRTWDEWLHMWDIDGSRDLDSLELEKMRLELYGNAAEGEAEFKRAMEACSQLGIIHEGHWRYNQHVPVYNLTDNCTLLHDKLHQQPLIPKFNFVLAPEDSLWFKMLHPNCSIMRRHFEELLAKPRKFLCLNDDLPHGDSESSCVKNLALQTLSHLYPTPSDFELANNESHGFATVAEWRFWQSKRDHKRNVLLGVCAVSCAAVFLMLFFRKLKRILLRPRRIFMF